MKPGPAAVADWVEENFALDSPPQDVTDVVIYVGTQYGWFQSPEEAAERAEYWRDRLVTRLSRLLNEASEENRPNRFEFNSSSGTKIQGFCFVSAADPLDVAEAKAARRFADAYRDHIRSLDDRDFEAICKGILRLIGCDDPVLTKKSGDQGIDVYGELKMTGRLRRAYVLGGPDALMTSWIAGQAKKYTIPVEVADMHQFVGAYNLARSGVFHGDGVEIKRFDPKPYQPVYLVFLTTGRLTRGAWQIAQRSGIVVLDEPVIASLLADHKVATVAGVFWAVRFTAWTEGRVAL